jgi:ferrous iron transport protein A
MTIKDMQVGQRGKVARILKGSTAERRLFEIGIVPGVMVKLLSRHPFQGPLLLEIGNARIALGRKIAASVEVEME